jgi:uncharacterized protein
LLECLDASNLEIVGQGCAVLAAGGGGDPELPLLMALRAVEAHGPVRVVRPEDLPPGDLVMPCGMVGAPMIAAERVWNGDEGGVLRDAVETLLARAVGALMCFEIGGANGLLPVTWAARIGLPLLDADGMGRAFTDLHIQAMGLAGIPATPVVLADGRGNTVVVHAADDRWADRLARDSAASLGGVCAGAVYCMTAEEAARGTIAGSLSHALELGSAIAAREAIGELILGEGRIIDVERRLSGAVGRSSATVQGTGNDAGRQLRLEMQNEFMLVLEDGAVRAAAPDIVCVLGSDSGAPIATERIQYGDRVKVFASPAPPPWRSAAGLALAGPAAFGYDVDYARA